MGALPVDHEADRADRPSSISAVSQRGTLEHLFVLISFGDLLGVPVLPPYYSLRLLPFVVPLINNWRRRMLRERDLMDAMF
ncbi:MAG: hypothetical protein HC846_05615 [Blastocatellia bacterium]|nr:hypothetical protein [Blastocatellia bacterium]